MTDYLDPRNLEEAMREIRQSRKTIETLHQRVAELEGAIGLERIAHHHELAALKAERDAAIWQPIETAPKDRGMFVVQAFNVDTGLSAPGGGHRYTTDPWCVWYSNGEFVRWPHPFPPTHWVPLPEAPKEPAMLAAAPKPGEPK